MNFYDDVYFMTSTFMEYLLITVILYNRVSNIYQYMHMIVITQCMLTWLIHKDMIIQDTGFELLRETREHEDEVTAFCHMVAR